ncbi:MAG: Xylose isomerase domain protein TIM barrel [Candidatus Uhrbacteria bacterium GW2011_GWF2_39_13]|uniref:Xylose isomerase domain protein TIM barrel n=1 Tax=Candidatus Uhrbacteria bacterium GW2011_GWF2_39_13 TaxID=1618995 RepID=A0A0G0QQ01_9BACT|nr:MAG: Xylose isomerase domain protein TIM barrel [Candidatus Uhrbacteria bacterium GW2011_GWF2_39_13]
MVLKERIGFFLPSLGFTNPSDSIDFVKKRGGLVQAWTISAILAHEQKYGIPFDFLKKKFCSGRLKISSLSGYMDWTDENKNHQRKEEFKRIVNQCAELKTDIICTETGRNFSERNDEKAWFILTKSIRELCRFAETKNVRIAIEMGRRDLVFGIAAFKKLQDTVGCNNLKINFDPANLFRGGLNPVDVLEELKGDIVQVHLKDADKNGMSPLTKGNVDFLRIFDILENNGYKGNYIIEQEYVDKRMHERVNNDYETAIQKFCNVKIFKRKHEFL